ncbi:unnamed protein product, partial [Iphiclides podalirius]
MCRLEFADSKVKSATLLFRNIVWDVFISRVRAEEKQALAPRSKIDDQQHATDRPQSQLGGADNAPYVT